MRRSAIALFAVALAPALLSGAAAAPSAAAKEPAPLVCTMEYAPVCGTVGKQRRTFGNLCMARGSGASRIVKGACRTARP